MTLYCKRHNKAVELKEMETRHTSKPTAKQQFNNEKPEEIVLKYLYCPKCNMTILVTSQVEADIKAMEEKEKAEQEVKVVQP